MAITGHNLMAFMFARVLHHRWAEYAEDELEDSRHAEDPRDMQKVLLLESMWSLHNMLQSGSHDRVSPRLSGRNQLAQTAYSMIYTAILDGEKKVVVKVIREQG
jgi:hypothetical protein